MTVWELASVLSKSLIYLGMLAAVGGMLVIWISRDDQSAAQFIARRFMLPAALAGLFASCLFFLVQAGSVNQRGVAGMFDPVMASILLDTEVGSALRWRLGGFLLVLLALMPLNLPGFPFQYTLPRRFSVMTMLAAATAFAVATGTQGHASSVSLPAQFLAGLHLLVIACWAGALYPLYLLVMQTVPGQNPAHVNPVHVNPAHVNPAHMPALTDEAGQPAAIRLGAVLHRFGIVSWFTLTLMLATGLALIWLLTGTIVPVPGNPHGQLLLLKLGLVAVMMGMGAIHKFRWVPQLRGLAASGENTRTVARRLALSIRLEIVLAVLVLLLTASLTTVTGPVA